MRLFWSTPALTLLLILSTAPPVWAWGGLGHRLTARIAERYLNPKAKNAVAALLEPGESLADASTWADDHQRAIRGSAPWHYVDVPLDQDRYDARFSGEDPKKGCIVEKIREFRTILKDPGRSVEERRFALRFLVHLLGDLHQPLHVGDNHDRGGNDTQVRFFDRGSNMHKVWDSDLIEHAGREEDFWLADLFNEMDSERNRAGAQRGTVEEWATESLLAARVAYLVPGTKTQIKPGERLGDEYQEANLLVVKWRLYEAGVRLAMVLNEIGSAD
jgi:hypothetical protein